MASRTVRLNPGPLGVSALLYKETISREVPEPEDFETKEVFAFFGLASYEGQVLEQALVRS